MAPVPPGTNTHASSSIFCVLHCDTQQCTGFAYTYGLFFVSPSLHYIIRVCVCMCAHTHAHTHTHTRTHTHNTTHIIMRYEEPIHTSVSQIRSEYGPTLPRPHARNHVRYTKTQNTHTSRHASMTRACPQGHVQHSPEKALLDLA